MTTKQAFRLVHAAAALIALTATVAEARVDKSIDGLRTSSPVQWIPRGVSDDFWLPPTPPYSDGGPRACELDGT